MVTDVDMRLGVHAENGFILHQTCEPADLYSLYPYRMLLMSNIPHGSQPMSFGNFTHVKTPSTDHYVQMLARVKESKTFSMMPSVPGCPSIVDEPPPNSTHYCCLWPLNIMSSDDYKCPETGCPEPLD